MDYKNEPGEPGSESWRRVFHYKDESCEWHFVGCVHRREYVPIPSPADIAGKSYRYSAYTDMSLGIKNGDENYFPTMEAAVKAIEETHERALEQARAVIAEI